MDLFATALAIAAEREGAAAGLAPQGGAAIDGADLRAVLARADAPSPHADGLFHWRGDRVMAVRLGPYKVHIRRQESAHICAPRR